MTLPEDIKAGVRAAVRVDEIAQKWLSKLNWTTEDEGESKAAHRQLHQAVEALSPESLNMIEEA